MVRGTRLLYPPDPYISLVTSRKKLRELSFLIGEILSREERRITPNHWAPFSLSSWMSLSFMALEKTMPQRPKGLGKVEAKKENDQVNTKLFGWNYQTKIEISAVSMLLSGPCMVPKVEIRNLIHLFKISLFGLGIYLTA